MNPPSHDLERPPWYFRRNLEPFTLTDDQIQGLIDRCVYATVAWVTQNNEPVQSYLMYAEVDGHVTITGTANRAKVKAWKRNPAASIFLVDPDSPAHVVCLRGKMEVIKCGPEDPELKAYVRALLGKTQEVSDELWADQWPKFQAPDRYLMKLHLDKAVSHNLAKLGWAEATGTDIWSALERGEDPFPAGL